MTHTPYVITALDLQLQTVEELRSLLEKIAGEVVPDSQLIFGNACFHASSLSDMSTKDVAELLMEGIQPKNTLESVQDTIDLHRYDAQHDDDGMNCGWLIHYYLVNVFNLDPTALESLLDEQMSKEHLGQFIHDFLPGYFAVRKDHSIANCIREFVELTKGTTIPSSVLENLHQFDAQLNVPDTPKLQHYFFDVHLAIIQNRALLMEMFPVIS